MNFIESGLAFLEGLALIASPCILPVLPLVLSTSIEGGKKRPFGIITGFVLAFTAFALISRKLVNALGVDLDIIKNVSLVLLALFGLVLLSSKLSEKFSVLTQGAANLGSRVSSSGGEGFFSGVGIGALIGLVWTPCAGPILAAVLVQVIRQESDLASLFIILPFAIGAGVPMLIIALMGRKIMSKLGFFATHAEAVRKTFGVIILAAVVFIASGIDPQSFFSKPAPQAVTLKETMQLEHAMPTPYKAPEFIGLDGWLNSAPLTIEALKGKVVLVDFWTYSCINCVRTLPYLTHWDQTYRDKGLVIVGVHSPEFEFEKKVENVKAAIEKHQINYPVALDNRLTTWSNFQNRYWPAHYLINQQGEVVYTHFGEGNYDVTENNIRFLLGIKDKVVADQQTAVNGAAITPETYLGYLRAERYAGAPALVNDQEQEYKLPDALAVNQWALGGGWNVGAEKINALKDSATLRLHFNAKKVFLVLGTADNTPVQVKIMLNGAIPAANSGQDVKEGVLTISQHTLYELIRQPELKEGVIDIIASQGLEAYAFTFGAE